MLTANRVVTALATFATFVALAMPIGRATASTALAVPPHHREPFMRATTRYLATSRGSLLTQVSLGPGTQLRAVDMLSSEFGYGIATTNDVASNADYLVATGDGARRWRVVAHMDVNVAAPADSIDVNPLMVKFVSTKIGYVSTKSGVDVTNDAGLTWRRVDLGAPVLDWRVGSLGLVAVTRSCVVGCPLRIVTAKLGWVTTRPQVAQLTSRVSDQRVAGLALEGRSEWILTTSPAVSGGDAHLWDVSGRGLVPLTEPCRSLRANGYVTTQLLVDRSGTYLYCFADIGMGQGYNELWYRAGLSSPWSLRLRTSPFRTTGRDSLGASEFMLGLADRGRRLVAASLGAYTGLLSSTDRGRTWTAVASTTLARVADAPSSLSSWGDGAMLLSNRGALFALPNGRGVVSHPLPTGVTSQIPWCSPQVSSVVLGPSSGPFGDYIVTVQVQGSTNASSCVLRGPAYIELTTSPSANGVARLLAAPSQLTPWPASTTLRSGEVLDFTVRFVMGGSTCAPTFVPQVILTVGPERFLAWDAQSPPLGICIHRAAMIVGRPYVYRPV